MTLFTVGPVEMDPKIRELGNKALPYFRTAEFSKLMLELEASILNLLEADAGSKAMILSTSGSGGMEASVASVFKPKRDKLLIINGGSFGTRFVEIAKHYQIPHEVLVVPFEDDLTPGMLEPYRNQGFTGLLVNHHETSIGKLYNLEYLGQYCKEEGLYLIVDAVSSFLCEPIRMKTWGIDLVMTASQKALALPPGLAIVATSKRLLEERILPEEGLSYYLSLRQAALNQERGQTPFTPALGIIYQLEERLARIKASGLEAEFKKRQDLAAYFREKVVDLGFKIPTYTKSFGLTPLLTSPIDAYELFLSLKDKHDMVITPSGGMYQSLLTRVGHMGYLQQTDYDQLLRCMKFVLEEKGR